MKKLIIIVFALFLSTNVVNAQSLLKPKTHGGFFTGSLNIGVIGNLDDVNSSLKMQYPNYKKLNPIQAGLRFGAGYFFKRFSIKGEFGTSVGTIAKDANQYSALTNYNVVATLGYAFLRYSFFDIEASVGIGTDINNFLHTHDLGVEQTSLPLVSNNAILPIGLTWWIYPSGTPSLSNGSIGINVTYNILVSKGQTKFTGLDATTTYPNIASNSLWFGMCFRL